jgi:hypothetical protein
MNDLLEFTKYYIAYSDLSKSNTSKLLTFVENATDNQLEYLLQTGYMVSEQEAIVEVSMVSALLKSASFHIDAISAFGFGNWLKSIPDAIDTAYQVGGQIGGKTMAAKSAFVAGAPPALAAGALATLIIWMSYKVTKAFLKKKVPDVCKKYKGDEKKQCIEKMNAYARKMRANDLQKSMAFCSKTKDPAKCKQKIAKKISAIRRGSND